jgi:hypothetical protein
MDAIKICNCCKDEKPLDCFGNNRANTDGKQKYCRECGKVRDKKHYDSNPLRRAKIKAAREEAQLRNRTVLLEFLKKHPCVDCGETDPLFLDFDHVRGKKRLAVTTAAKHGWCLEALQEEIDKCQVRCVRCHRIKTAKEQGWFELYGGQGNAQVLDGFVRRQEAET